MKLSKGFTLLELAIVIVVIGILSAVAIPKVVNIQDDAKVAVVRGTASTLNTVNVLVNTKAIVSGMTEGDHDVPIDKLETIKAHNGYVEAVPETIQSILLLNAAIEDTPEARKGKDWLITTNPTEPEQPRSVTIRLLSGTSTCKIIYTEALPYKAPKLVTVADPSLC